MCLFYQTEMHAFEATILREAFAEVGLWPWNPVIILSTLSRELSRSSSAERKQISEKVTKDNQHY